MKTICIVIPVYKSHSFISRLFSSLNQASATNLFSWTIYFVDDSPEVDFNWDSFIAGLKIKNKVFKNIDWVRNKKNRGVTFSRNRAYLSTKADFYVFFDSDDEARPGALEGIELEIKKMESKCNVLLMATSASKSEQKCLYSNDYQALLDDYGKGERLVIVRFCPNIKPFFGVLRGHELSGLLRFCVSTNSSVITSEVCVRNYLSDNEHSISQGHALRARLPYLITGHLWVSKFLAKRGRFLLSLRFFLAAIKHQKNLWNRYF